ncbi:MAG: exonuclease SbcCD subunit D [Thermotogaceae bacterium]|nr:exonuclease SbcCD subunit D [Thermotogaceae bacterium]
MKILHTADWHIGLKSWKVEKETDRTEEILNSLEQILEGAKKENVDLIVVAGDVLHESRNPSAESLNILMKYLSEFSKVAPTVVVMGNHDWKGLMSYSHIAPRDLYISVRPEKLVIDTNSGRVAVYTVPFVREAPAEPDGKRINLTDRIAGLIQEFAHDDISADFRLLASHLMVEKTGVIPPSVEENIHVILKSEHFSALFDYVALGHVHRHVIIKDVPYVVYSGSIIQDDFSEWKDRKGYVILEDKNIRFAELSHRKLGVLDFSGERDFKAVIGKLEQAIHEFDYIKLKINHSLSHYRGTLLRYDKVKSVSVESYDIDRVDMRKEFEGLDFYEIFEEYLQKQLSGEFLKEALKILEEIKGEDA